MRGLAALNNRPGSSDTLRYCVRTCGGDIHRDSGEPHGEVGEHRRRVASIERLGVGGDLRQ
jgi:hypothetical protein